VAKATLFTLTPIESASRANFSFDFLLLLLVASELFFYLFRPEPSRKSGTNQIDWSQQGQSTVLISRSQSAKQQNDNEEDEEEFHFQTFPLVTFKLNGILPKRGD